MDLNYSTRRVCKIIHIRHFKIDFAIDDEIHWMQKQSMVAAVFVKTGLSIRRSV